MPAIAVGRCSNCDAPVSYLARFCPHCRAANWPNPFVTVVALFAVALGGGSIVLGALFFPWSKRAPQEVPRSEQKVEAEEDYGWIVKAMAECDVVANRTAEALYFLMLPLTTTGIILPGWEPRRIGTIGNSIWLVSATDALIGLRNGVLGLYPREVTVAVSDPKTNRAYKWKPAVGVRQLTKRETFDALKLGFQIADIGSEIAWGPTISIAKGTCYWINPVIQPAARK